ncbi:nitroreductase [Streptomyces sp. CAU 1734]|uniref:nitroreductase n=1 Tax=Streptomyces sp. CAU 1734 TaxID=3140360 RepID=UPI003261C7B1
MSSHDAELVRAALARARSGEAPAAVSPVRGRAFPGGRPGPAVPLPPGLDRMLRLSLAALPGTSGGRLRPVPSAGALHPVNARLLAGPGGPLPPGRHIYDPLTHRLHRTGPAPAGAPPGILAVLTVTPRRTVTHYGHRAWPLLLLDAGHAAAALALAGAHACAPDADGGLLAAAAGLGAGTEEHPLLAVELTADCPGDAVERWARGRPADGAGTGTAQPGAETHRPGGSGAAPEHLPAALPELAAAHRILTALTRAPRPLARPRRHRVAGSRPGPVSDAVLLARRSSAPDFPGVPGDGGLTAVLAAAEDACPVPLSWYAAAGGPRPGVWRRAEGGLRRVAAGDARPALAAWAAGQGWLAGAGAVVLAAGCPGDAPPARVRTDHLAAGYAMGFAQVTAAALGLRSRLSGSWQRADLGAALGRGAGREWVLHGLALGSPGEPDGTSNEGGDEPT